MFRAVGFDLGDTLIFYDGIPLNWAERYPAALATVAEACGISPNDDERAAAREILLRYNTRVNPRAEEVSAEEIFSLVLHAWKVDPAMHLARSIESFFSFFQEQMLPFPDALPVLRTLGAQGIRIGLLTDVPYGMPLAFVQRDLDRAGLRETIDVLVTSTIAGRRKPDPAGFLELAKRLGAAPAAMLFVGNEPRDVIGANRAGLVSALLDRDRSGLDHGQRFTFSTLAEIDRLFDPQPTR